MCSLRYCIDFCYDIDTVGLTYEAVFQTCFLERIWVGLWFILLIGMICLKNLNLTWLLLFQRWRKIGISSASVQFRGLWSSAGPTSTAAETCHAVCVLTGQFPLHHTDTGRLLSLPLLWWKGKATDISEEIDLFRQVEGLYLTLVYWNISVDGS